MRFREIVETVDPKDILAKVVNADLLNLRKAFQSRKFDIRIVGGAVRDIISGKTPKDIDLCTDATPDEQIEVYRTNGYRYVETGIEHGTITVVIKGEPYEITSLRTESDHDGRYAKMAFTRDWTEDLSRRDLTVNAMALTFDGELLDPFNGQADLEAGHARFVGDARERMREDYLRILRFFRFFGRIGEKHPDQETIQSIMDNADGLKQISGERIWQEMSKILVGPRIKQVLELMDSTGVAAVIGMPNRNLDKVEHVGHTTKNPITALAAALHNEAEVTKLSQSWKWSTDERELARFLVKWQFKPLNQKDFEHMLIDRVNRNWVVQLAMLQGKAGVAHHVDNWTVPVFPVTGNDLISRGMKPGAAMGATLADLKSKWKASQYAMSKDELLAQMGNA